MIVYKHAINLDKKAYCKSGATCARANKLPSQSSDFTNFDGKIPLNMVFNVTQISFAPEDRVEPLNVNDVTAYVLVVLLVCTQPSP